jgi:hypothetical protein
VPYDPDAFFIQDLTGNGTRDTTGELEPITACLSVVRQPTAGRLGHIFYRGVLSQADTSAPSGITILNDPTAILGEISAALVSSDFQTYVGPDGGAPLTLAMINATGTLVRLVNDLLVGGVVQLPVDHAWFNRT